MLLPSVTADALGLQTPDEIFAAQSVRLVDASSLIQPQIERYDFPEDLFDDLIILQPNTKVLRASARQVDLPAAPHIDRIGMDFLRIDMKAPRLTTAAAMTWGHLARQNFAEVTDKQLDLYLLRERILLNTQQIQNCTDRGPILIRYLGHCLGLGFLETTDTEHELCGSVRSLYPRAFAVDVAQASALGNPL